jgi:hypothetical protein
MDSILFTIGWVFVAKPFSCHNCGDSGKADEIIQLVRAKPFKMDELNKLGASGWELVWVDTRRFYFKRELDKEGFIAAYYEGVRAGQSCKEAFEAVNQEYYMFFKKYKYADYR